MIATERPALTPATALRARRRTLIRSALITGTFIAPALMLRLAGLHAEPVAALLIFGAAVVSASFLLAWAAEAAQKDVRAGRPSRCSRSSRSCRNTPSTSTTRTCPDATGLHPVRRGQHDGLQPSADGAGVAGRRDGRHHGGAEGRRRQSRRAELSPPTASNSASCSWRASSHSSSRPPTDPPGAGVGAAGLVRVLSLQGQPATSRSPTSSARPRRSGSCPTGGAASASSGCSWRRARWCSLHRTLCRQPRRRGHRAGHRPVPAGPVAGPAGLRGPGVHHRDHLRRPGQGLAAIATLISSEVNQWTLLVGSLPVAHLLGGGGCRWHSIPARSRRCCSRPPSP